MVMEMDNESVRDKRDVTAICLAPITRLEVTPPGTESNLPALSNAFFFPHWKKSHSGKGSK
jgi:hypothetical protein